MSDGRTVAAMTTPEIFVAEVNSTDKKMDVLRRSVEEDGTKNMT
jgi:hypothetical protein